MCGGGGGVGGGGVGGGGAIPRSLPTNVKNGDDIKH